jgi:Kef-type K+ transport system membrane component KefB
MILHRLGVEVLYPSASLPESMPEARDVGRPVPVLLIMLWGSFVLMVLTGVLFALGLPEDWARALFIATVIIWLVLGVALMVQGNMETKALAGRARPVSKEDGGDDTD